MNEQEKIRVQLIDAAHKVDDAYVQLGAVLVPEVQDLRKVVVLLRSGAAGIPEGARQAYAQTLLKTKAVFIRASVYAHQMGADSVVKLLDYARKLVEDVIAWLLKKATPTIPGWVKIAVGGAVVVGLLAMGGGLPAVGGVLVKGKGAAGLLGAL